MTATAEINSVQPFVSWVDSRPPANLFENALSEAVKVQQDARRALHVAFDALLCLYPTYGSTRLAIRLGYLKPANATAALASAKLQFWWNDCHVDEVIGALVADQYGERAN
ncbi:hypothetical protein ASC97_05790 [Rhizobium sp. Root1203]|uniref:hypothetical protein n=1 Tax=Rhizobium sp. Root1203 TaxID=1736427 RepID=UPI0007107B25|nr:hypothetical protein [Rhizobium sp. Root1203]KQV27873.1 hypothetical protein ASC97_05790 [Rhizobium sp. Root1203]